MRERVVLCHQIVGFFCCCVWFAGFATRARLARCHAIDTAAAAACVWLASKARRHMRSAMRFAGRFGSPLLSSRRAVRRGFSDGFRSPWPSLRRSSAATFHFPSSMFPPPSPRAQANAALTAFLGALTWYFFCALVITRAISISLIVWWAVVVRNVVNNATNCNYPYSSYDCYTSSPRYSTFAPW